LTIYNKLINDFTPNTPKYVFKGISEFSLNTPELITGDNYENRGNLLNSLISCKINISKINSEVRGGKEPHIKRLSEYLGESYFNFLANLDDLVILMDESHRYRASVGIRAINELKPILGLELTAIPFKNIIFDYPLRRTMEDGFVKEPAVGCSYSMMSRSF
jgi:type III restriction enzyme